ncbi:DeoR/GlpR family DNA-binding transcription regulator [Bacillus sp. F19]|nr:DeoR/GlpR family DNA-binding transcription regulator [Bacillus sp. F19]
MLSVERHQIILNHLNLHGKITIHELLDQLKVSKQTIRRDLEHLEQQGKLTKVHGGAVKKVISEKYEPSFNERINVNIEEKKKIGARAAEMIQDGDVVAFGIGTTTLQVANNIRNKKNLTILLSCVRTLNSLIELKRAGIFTGKIIFLAGEINTDLMAGLGSLTLQNMHQFQIDKAFIGGNGITLEHGLSTYDIEDGNFLKKLISISKEVTLVIDHSKRGISSLYHFAKIEQIQNVISTADVPEDWKEVLQDKNIQWIKV